MMKGGIRKVAQMAGVSISTVSLVFNQPARVSEATRFKVLAIAEKLNYRPNRIARSLVTKRTKIIGLVLPDITDPFFPEVARGVEDTLNDCGYSVILCNTDNNIEKEIKYITLLYEQQVDGIILAPVGKKLEHIQFIIDKGKPLVFIDRTIDSLPVSYVVADNLNGGYLAVKYLLQNGHRQIACIAGEPMIQSSEERIQGYKNALYEYQLPIDETLIYYTNFKSDGGYKATKNLLSKRLNIDAFFVVSDIVAYGVLDALHEAGIQVPEDISVIGFDDIPFSKYLHIPLTTIHQPRYELGKEAAQVILSLVSNRKKIIYQKKLDVSLVVRDSVK
jgi:LacI family transcriptional regulator